MRLVEVALGLPLTHAAGHPPQLVMPPMMGATGTMMDFGLSVLKVKVDGDAIRDSFRGVATNGAVKVWGCFGGRGVFLPGDSVPDFHRLVGG